MADVDLTQLLAGNRGTVCGDAKVWTRGGSGANVVVLTNDRLFVGLVPRQERKTAPDRIAAEEPIEAVLGDHFQAVPLTMVQEVRAEAESGELHVEYTSSGGKTETLPVRLPNEEARNEAMDALQARWSGNVERVEEVSNRLVHALEPLNGVIVCSLLAWGAHWYFQSGISKVPDRVVKGVQEARSQPPKRSRPRLTMEQRIDRNDFRDVKFHQNPDPPRNNYTGPTKRALAGAMARNKKATGIIAIGVAILGALAFALNWIGYSITVYTLLGFAGLCALGVLCTFIAPPRRTLLRRAEIYSSV